MDFRDDDRFDLAVGLLSLNLKRTIAMTQALDNAKAALSSLRSEQASALAALKQAQPAGTSDAEIESLTTEIEGLRQQLRDAQAASSASSTEPVQSLSSS